MATSVKDSTRINDHAGRVNFSGDHALRLNFHASAGKDYPIEVSRDDDSVALNLSLYFCILTQDNSLLGNYISLNVTVDAERSCQRQGSFERNSLINESCPLFASATLR